MVVAVAMVPAAVVVAADAVVAVAAAAPCAVVVAKFASFRDETRKKNQDRLAYMHKFDLYTKI